MKKLGKVFFKVISILMLLLLLSTTNRAAEEQTKNINVNETVSDSLFSNQKTYSFTLKNDGYINIKFTHDDLKKDTKGWKLELYSENKTYLYTHMVSNKNETETQSFNIGLTKGNYILVINPYNNERLDTTYQLKINYHKSDSWEKEPNNGYFAANKLKLNEAVNGSITLINDINDYVLDDDYYFNDEEVDFMDYDWYYVDLPENGYINIEYSYLTKDLSMLDVQNIYLYDTYKDMPNHLITGLQVTKNKTKDKSNNIGLPKGKYYITVGAPEGEYKLKVNYKKSSNWEKEPNESISSANTLKINHKIKGNINESYDLDYYKINLSKKSKVRIEFEHKIYKKDSTKGWKISLYDKKGKIKNTFVSKACNQKTNSKIITLEKGIYYIGIMPYSKNNNYDCEYTVSISKK